MHSCTTLVAPTSTRVSCSVVHCAGCKGLMGRLLGQGESRHQYLAFTQKLKHQNMSNGSRDRAILKSHSFLTCPKAYGSKVGRATRIIFYGWWALRRAGIRPDEKKKLASPFYFYFFLLHASKRTVKLLVQSIWSAHFPPKMIISIEIKVWFCRFLFFHFYLLRHQPGSKFYFYFYFLLQGKKAPVGIRHP